jgi:hypothetical protein
MFFWGLVGMGKAAAASLAKLSPVERMNQFRSMMAARNRRSGMPLSSLKECQQKHPIRARAERSESSGSVMKRSLLIFVSMYCVSLLNGCGGGPTTTPPPPPPVIANATLPTGLTGAAYPGFTFTVASGGTGPFTWSETGALPPGLNLDKNSGAVTGTPTGSGVYTFTVQVTDSGRPPQFATQQVGLTINAATIAITSPPPPAGNPGYTYFGSSVGYALSAAGGVTPYKWSWAAAVGSSLPPGLSVSTNADNTGSISGTPTMAGSYNVVVTVADSQSPASKFSSNYTISIAAPATLAITSGAPPDGMTGVRYHRVFNQTYGKDFYGFDLTASGGVGPYIWSWSGSQVSPIPGLGICTNYYSCGRAGSLGTAIVGTPATAGTYNVTLTVTDSESPTVQKNANYTIIIDSPPPPTVLIAAPPIGTLNVAYPGFTFTGSGGQPPYTWTESGALPLGLSFSTGGVLSGTPTAAGSFPIAISIQDSANNTSAPQDFTIQVMTLGFAPTGSLTTPRVFHTATLLGDGKVLVTCGATDATHFPVTAEVYDLTNQTFALAIGSMETPRVSATATLLKNGKVLVAGGNDASGKALASAELYDPATGAFTPTSNNMVTPHVFHTATLLNDGRVLIAGGVVTIDNPFTYAELFDPATATFASTTGNMVNARSSAAAALLADGKVLLAGGYPVATSELFDPATGAFTPSGGLTVARTGHTATTLKSGLVLLTGGAGHNGIEADATAELYDPSTGAFTATAANLTVGRVVHTATLLNDGTVLIIGGDDTYLGFGVTWSSAEIFDPVAGTFARTVEMTSPRESHTATLLNSGQVLVIGGSNGTLGYSPTVTVLATAELYH